MPTSLLINVILCRFQHCVQVDIAFWDSGITPYYLRSWPIFYNISSKLIRSELGSVTKTSPSSVNTYWQYQHHSTMAFFKIDSTIIYNSCFCYGCQHPIIYMINRMNADNCSETHKSTFQKIQKNQWMPASHPQISEKEDASIYAIFKLNWRKLQLAT